MMYDEQGIIAQHPLYGRVLDRGNGLPPYLDAKQGMKRKLIRDWVRSVLPSVVADQTLADWLNRTVAKGDECSDLVTEIARDISRQQEAWLQARLSELEPGHTLCVHGGALGYASPYGPSWVVEVHTLAAGEACKKRVPVPEPWTVIQYGPRPEVTGAAEPA